jgi:dienelactone hydrolase
VADHDADHGRGEHARVPWRTALLSLLFIALSTGCATPPSPAGTRTTQDTPTPTRRATLTVDGTDLSLHLPSTATPPLPAVLMFHSAMGPTDAVRGYADALTEAGFAACVLDFYGGRVAENVEQAVALRDDANDRLPELTALVQHTGAALRSDPRVLAPRLYLVGWSYGGAWATFAAADLERVSGVVAIYGEAFSGNPTLIERDSAPLLMVGATEDTEPSPDTLHELRDAIRDRGNAASVLIVEAGHGFMEPNHPGYAKQPAARAWAAVVEFLNGLELPPADNFSRWR